MRIMGFQKQWINHMWSKIVERWKICLGVVVALCIICPLLVPIFGVVLLGVGIYGHNKANSSMIILMTLTGTIFMLLTIFYIVLMCTTNYGIFGVFSSVP